MKLGSLFSGIGGLDFAVKEAFPEAELVWLLKGGSLNLGSVARASSRLLETR